MKLSLAIAAVLAAVSLSAAEKVIFQDSFENAANWFRNGKNGQFKFVDGGKNGKCMNIVTEKYAFLCNLRKGLPVKEGVKVKVTFFAKGKGFMTTTPMGRKGNQVAYLKGGGAFKLDEKDWKECSVTFAFQDAKLKGIDNLGFRLNFYDNSNLMVDDFLLTVIE